MTAPRPAWVAFFVGLLPIITAIPPLSARIGEGLALLVALVYLPLLRIAAEWMERRVNRLLALRRIERKRNRATNPN